MVAEAKRSEARSERFQEIILRFQRTFGKSARVIQQFQDELGRAQLHDHITELKRAIERAEERKRERGG